MKRFDSTYRTILNTGVRRYNFNGEFAGLLCFCLDITLRKRIEQVIRQAQIERILTDITQSIHSSLNLNVIFQTAAEQVDRYLLPHKIFITKIVDRSELILLYESGLGSYVPNCNISLNDKLPVKEMLNNFDRLAQGQIIARDNTSL